MNLSVIEMLSHLFAILVLYMVLRKALYKPVIKFLTARKERVDETLKHSEEVKAQYSSIAEIREQGLEKAKNQAEMIVSEARERAGGEAERITSEAHDQARDIIKWAKEEGETERAAALGSLQDQTVGIAVDIASSILKREINAEDHREIIDDFLKRVG